MSYTVNINHEESHMALDWVIENCPSYITNRVDLNYDPNIPKPFLIKFHFTEEKDATLFALRWK